VEPSRKRKRNEADELIEVPLHTSAGEDLAMMINNLFKNGGMWMCYQYLKVDRIRHNATPTKWIVNVTGANDTYCLNREARHKRAKTYFVIECKRKRYRGRKPVLRAEISQKCMCGHMPNPGQIACSSWQSSGHLVDNEDLLKVLFPRLVSKPERQIVRRPMAPAQLEAIAGDDSILSLFSGERHAALVEQRRAAMMSVPKRMLPASVRYSRDLSKTLDSCISGDRVTVDQIKSLIPAEYLDPLGEAIKKLM
jgi:hypothetical protein